MKSGILKIIGLIACIVFQSCKIADLRTAQISSTSLLREEKAIMLLTRAIDIQSYEKLAAAHTYTITARDDWKELFAIANPLPKDNELMEMRFRPNSFDGQFNYYGNGTVYGVQSFQFYKIKQKDTVYKKKKSVVFTLPAIQYFFELPLRLKNAPILKYAGTKEFEGSEYDLVFATWDRLEPHKEHDQYLLYFDRNSGMLSFASYTVRGMYLSLVPRNIYGSIHFTDIKTNKDGIHYPGKMFVQLNRLKNKKRGFHTITVDSLKLNNFDRAKLYPNKNIDFLGDGKQE